MALLHLLSVYLLIGLCISLEQLELTQFSRQAEASVSVPSWGYTGLNGPLNWYGLDKNANSLCAKGKHQSPINLDHNCPPLDGNLSFYIPSGESLLENHGVGIEVPYPRGFLNNHGKNYSLTQFHFHTPSEHRVHEISYPMEVHFVFQSPEDSSRAVVGFFIDFGLLDPLLREVFKNIAAIPLPGNKTITGYMNFANLMSNFSSAGAYQYSGSLTTPPCDEDVAWSVSCAPLYIDVATYIKVRDVIKFNSRYTQNTPGLINLLQNAANEINGPTGYIVDQAQEL